MNDMTPEQLEAGNDWLETTTCTHDKSECPNHEGNFDCNPFCALCEGEQEYCPTCEDPTQAEVDAYLDSPTRDCAECDKPEGGNIPRHTADRTVWLCSTCDRITPTNKETI